MVNSKDSRMISFHIPQNPDLLVTLGIVALKHANLDYILRMTIKTLGEVTVQQALDATAFESSRGLRDRVRKLAKQKLGEGNPLIQLQALLERCKRATEKRNDLIHNIWARELDGEPLRRTNDHDWKPLPTIEELNALSEELTALTNKLNDARLLGFLAEALAIIK
jgi:hypothetical protein